MEGGAYLAFNCSLLDWDVLSVQPGIETTDICVCHDTFNFSLTLTRVPLGSPAERASLVGPMGPILPPSAYLPNEKAERNTKGGNRKFSVR